MTVKDMVYAALFAAITAALGLLPMFAVPGISAPITAQSLGVMLAGSVLGSKRGGLAMLVFIGLVAAGLALLAGGRGGIGVLMGPTGGFAIGYIFGAIVTGWLTESMWTRYNFTRAMFACVVGGIGVVYLLGIPWLGAVTKIGLTKAAMASLAFVPGDILKAILVSIVAVAMRKSYPLVRGR